MTLPARRMHWSQYRGPHQGHGPTGDINQRPHVYQTTLLDQLKGQQGQWSRCRGTGPGNYLQAGLVGQLSGDRDTPLGIILFDGLYCTTQP
jgi:hypothetical protein